MEIVSLIILGVIFLVLIIATLYSYIYFANPLEKSGFFIKLLIIVSMCMCWVQFLLIPVDIANNRGGGLGLNMHLGWRITYAITIMLIFLILPLAKSYNDSDEEWSIGEKLKYKVSYTLVLLIIVYSALFVSYLFLSTSKISARITACSIMNLSKSDFNSLNFSCDVKEKENIYYTVSFDIFIIGFISFFSWFIFCLFTGIGIVYIPIDFLRDFLNRPKIISKAEQEKEKEELLAEARELKLLAKSAKEISENETEILKKSSNFFI